MRRRFFWSLLGAMAATLLIVTALGALVTLSVVRAQTRQEMQRQVGQITGLIQDAFVTDGVDLDGASARDLLAENSAPTVRRILLEAGRMAGPEAQVRLVAVTSGQRIVGGELPAAVVQAFDFASILSGETMARRVVDLEGGAVVEVVAEPVAEIGRTGTVLAAVLIHQSDVLEFRSIIRQMVFPLLVAALVAAVVAGRLSKWFVKRLAHLREAASELAGGNHEARAAVEGSDEIAAVAGSFNEMADELDAARQREREFLMSVGHDLRTPLTTVSGYVEVLQEGNLDGPELSRIAGVLERETGRLKRLIEDLMLLARLESNEFSIRAEPVEVSAHLGETIDAYRGRAEAAHVTLRFESAGGGTVAIDPDRLDQIAGNLIENALRYTPEAGTVTVRLAVGPGSVRLEVVDTGGGISADDLPHVFEKFYVARKYRRVRPEGSGLGLSIVHEIVTAMGGTIDARSNIDHPGTIITVLLPTKESAAPTM
jgi:two-component system sensor histidine kinase BaeS